jgi:hypothetical protein
VHIPASESSIELSQILSAELVPGNINKISPELAQTQGLVAAFVDALKQVYNRVAGLSIDIEQHQRHIDRLKQELSAACKRQADNEEVQRCTVMY